MEDVEKVVKGLSIHGNPSVDCTNGCPYYDEDVPGTECVEQLCRDAFELLKEYVAKK